MTHLSLSEIDALPRLMFEPVLAEYRLNVFSALLLHVAAGLRTIRWGVFNCCGSFNVVHEAWVRVSKRKYVVMFRWYVQSWRMPKPRSSFLENRLDFRRPPRGNNFGSLSDKNQGGVEFLVA